MKIFLVEDSPSIRHRVKSCIGKIEGMEINGEADNQNDAVTQILHLQPDVVVLDLALAEGTGIGVLKKIKTHFPKMCVIIFSNHTAAPYREKCRELGADYFLDKNREFNLLKDLLVLAAHPA